ncbi:hypothetical protein ACTSKR_10710 [Chitinibacteraceae bacterium HSL-7]
MKLPSRLATLWQRWLAGRHPVAALDVTLRHNRIYVLPTPFGLGFAGVAVLILIGAINYQLSLGYLFTFMLVGLGHAATIEAFRNLLGIRLRAGRTEPCFAGAPLIWQVQVENGRKRSLHALYIRIANEEGYLNRADAGESGVIRITMPTRTRGWQPLPRLTLESRFPSGWVRVWSYATLDASALVYPAPEANAPPYPGSPDGDSGEHRNSAEAGDDVFAGLREYRPGDAMARIAWKRAATSDDLTVKAFETPHLARHALTWQATEGLATEHRIARLTAWVLHADLDGGAYRLLLPNFDSGEDRGPAHRHRCLSALATYGLDAP